MGKVTMQDIAENLGISRVSVWKVFNGQSGVSETLKRNVLEAAEKLGYMSHVQGISGSEEKHKQYKTVSLVVSRPDSAIFWTDIIHSLAKELSLYNINLVYTYMPGSYTNNFQLPSILTDGEADGLVTLNIYDKNIIRKLNSLSIPKVFLDTVPSVSENVLKCDLVLIEGRRIFSEMVDAVVKNGCKKIGFIGDISYARTNFERYQGFIDGLERNNIKHDPSFCFINSIGIYNYQNIIFDYMSSLTEFPDAIMCVSDYTAQFVCMYISEHPERFKKPVLISGFDGSKEYVNVADKIITASVKTRQLGKKLAFQIFYRMENPAAPYETIYIHPEITTVTGSTFP